MTTHSSPLTAASERELAAIPASPRNVLLLAEGAAPALASALAALGCEAVSPAANAPAALESARKRRPDLAVIELIPGQPDRSAAAQTLAAELKVPTLFVSSASDPALVEAAVAAGGVGYLLLPVSAEQLGVAMPVLWARHRQERRLGLESQDAQLRLEQRKHIERAKGILMKTKGVTEEEAMRSLQKQARDTRRPMIDVAKELIAASEPPPAAAAPGAAPAPPAKS